MGFFAFYIGPDQVMPVASLLATLFGSAMIFWGKLRKLLSRLFAGTRREEKGE